MGNILGGYHSRERFKSATPAKMINPVAINGSFGKLLTTNLKCGCSATKKMQNAAKYSMYGVKIEQAIVIANKNEYIGFGRLSP